MREANLSLPTQLLTKKEVCALFRCSSRTLDRWRSIWRAKGVETGEVKIGKKANFLRDAIERIVKTPKLWVN
jgi:hypothetical protein